MRSLRRHHRDRIKARRRNYWGRDLRKEPANLGKVSITPHPCSCLMCGNARRHSGATRQERYAMAEELLGRAIYLLESAYKDHCEAANAMGKIADTWVDR